MTEDCCSPDLVFDIDGTQYGYSTEELEALARADISEKQLRSRFPILEKAWKKYQSIRRLLA